MPNTKDDVARILESVNEAAARLKLEGAGHWTVEGMGGAYLYLTDRSNLPAGHTGPGERIEDLGKTWHRAYDRLWTLRRDLLTVQIRQAKEN